MEALLWDFFSKIFKETDRFLDRRIGIDDPGTRTGIIITAAAIGGGYAGAAIAAGGAGAAIGAGALTTGTIGGIGIGTIGATAGTLAGASLASKALAKGGMTPSQVTGAVKPPSSFGGDVLASQERLRKRLALQMSTGKTNVTGGVRGFSQTVRPTLMTL